MNRRNFLFAAGLVAALPLVARAGPAPSSPFKLGVHYDKLLLSPAAKPKGVREITEFYSVTCGHCARHEPSLVAWELRNPNVTFVRKSVDIHSGQKRGHSLAGELLAGSKHASNRAALFAGYHKSRNLRTDSELAAWMVTRGYGKDWAKDPSLNKRLNANREFALLLGVSGVPTFIVNGRYRTTPTMAGERLTQVLDFLLAL